MNASQSSEDMTLTMPMLEKVSDTMCCLHVFLIARRMNGKIVNMTNAALNWLSRNFAGAGRFQRRTERPFELMDRRGEQGYSLVEILVVLAIIGLIMGLVGPRVLNSLSDSKAKAARLQIDSFSTVLDLYYLDNGRYPTTAEGLVSLVQKPDGAASWRGPYLKTNSVPYDPWGRPYIYRSPGQQGPYDIISLGAEGREDNANAAANITNWQR